MVSGAAWSERSVGEAIPCFGGDCFDASGVLQ